MVRKIVIFLLIVFGFIINASANTNFNIRHDDNIKTIEDNYFDTLNNYKKDAEARASNTDVTMLDFASFLIEKKEHYPLSDEFIEKYQQKSGGYIDYAKQTGHLVDKQKHEPNQKWHFFESWLLESFKAKTIKWEDSAKSRVYSKLLCPELLLWIYEASDVDPAKVKKAKDAAESGKSQGLATTTIAKNMRACVSWDDFKII